ncbi:molecular chaperone HtpG [Dokdonella immobilis]|uniref:Chaperone protein HtpG n=1 Tax=Dokdonella immobilis TaxID=578942 RepID=A0A1I4VZP9_9GAMM|nr:molecular chaperone HtpG [Dokdonella immobilis]SFN06486.1 molecular chaperone HtpG [Dokdonella immobilis]
MSTTAETRKFEAEVAQVLHLVTHSLYSHKEIFLRELISNASDACDKLRFEALAHPEWLADDAELRIDVSFDAAARTLSVHDNGIGMDRDELVANLGTIASSGTRRYLESLAADKKADSRLIGQFGVGFYSAFVVADRVTVTSRRAGTSASDGVRWESDGQGEYSLESVEVPKRGTTVTLHLKADESEFLETWKLRSLVSRYSDHIGFPIRMPKAVDGEATAEWETVNSASALWTRPKSELKDEDYQNFYKSLSHDFSDALTWTHNRVEGNQNFTSLLYIPAKAPFDFMNGREERKGLKLYIRRVFIMDASEQLLPAYLRFVRGVVDSDDLPLNVSREILQQNRQVERIRGACTKRVLDLLDKLAVDEAEKYATFWSAFGSVLKEGIAEDAGNRERIAKLLRFASTHSEGAAPSVSLDDYIGRMKAGQEIIWYITADSYAAAKGSPQLEALKAQGVEVLLMSDRIDEWMAGYLTEYAGKKLRHVGKGEIELDAAASEAHKASEEAASAVVARLKELLGERVRDVKVSRRLTESPSCLVLDEYDMALHLRRVLKQSGHDMPDSAPVLEINPGHALVKRLEVEADNARASDLALLLLEQAQVAEGAQLEDPAAFVQRLNRVILEAPAGS